MYKDKEKQREAAKERARRYRNAHKEGVTPVTPSVTPLQSTTTSVSSAALPLTPDKQALELENQLAIGKTGMAWPPWWMNPFQCRDWMREYRPLCVESLKAEFGGSLYKGFADLGEDEFNTKDGPCQRGLVRAELVGV